MRRYPRKDETSGGEEVKVLQLWRSAMPITALIAIAACGDRSPPSRLDKFCVSESGLSKYWLALDTSASTGWIRYQYMGQDVRYAITNMQVEGAKVSGRADFESSLSGETRGTPIVFNYDNDTSTLTDGSATSHCENDQSDGGNWYPQRSGG